MNADRIIDLKNRKATGKIVAISSRQWYLGIDLLFDDVIVKVKVVGIVETQTVNEYAATREIHRNTVLRWIEKGKLLAHKGKSPAGKSCWLIPTIVKRRLPLPRAGLGRGNTEGV